MEAMKSGQFAFPPIIDVRIDQAKAEIVIDRDKVASMGLTMQQVGADLSSMLGGNFVNRFNIDGRSYKVIPQIERAGRLTPEQLADIHVTGPGRPARSRCRRDRDAPQRRRAAHAEPLPAAERDQDLGRRDRARSTAGSRVLEDDRRARSCRPATTLDYTGESRQLRQEGGKFLPAMGLALLLIFLVLAAQFNSFRDPFVILAGSVPLAMFGALIFTFLKFAGPPGMTLRPDRGLDDDAQHLLAGRPGHAGRPRSRRTASSSSSSRTRSSCEGMDKIDAVRAAATHRLRPILMTTVATVAGHFPLTLVTGPGAVARNSIGIVLVGGMTHRHAVHAVRRPVGLRPHRQGPPQREGEARSARERRPTRRRW